METFGKAETKKIGKVETKNIIFAGLNIREMDNIEVLVDQNDFMNKINAGDYTQKIFWSEA